MFAGVIGFALGLTLGAATGTEGAAYGGAIFGMSVGLAVWGIAWMRTHLGDAPTVERHRVFCTTLGQAADVDVAGDLATHRWSSIERCSLLDHEVDCHQGCLAMIRQSGAKPGRACACQAVATRAEPDPARADAMTN